MNYIKIGKFILIILGVILLQMVFPSIYYNNFKISPDFMLLLLTYLAFRMDRFSCVIIGFILGILQDTISQIELFGIYAFIKSCMGFALGSLRGIVNIWPKSFIFILILTTYLLHFAFYYFIKLNGTATSILIGGNLVLMHTTINIGFIFLLDKFFFQSGLLKIK